VSEFALFLRTSRALATGVPDEDMTPSGETSICDLRVNLTPYRNGNLESEYGEDND